ncbi:MAG: alpha/beta fold hydrolase [Clostridia bacterium]|nr:alpha/beta fold hydrolase [Clostridia bacterium]
MSLTLYMASVPQWVWIAIGIFVAVNLLLCVPFHFWAAQIAHRCSMSRREKKQWSRECSSDEPYQREMYDEGCLWAEKHADRRHDLHMVNDGLNLYAEYFDLGFDRTVFVIPGRTEGLRYGYYFAIPYAERGFNVMVIDQRAHGESDGVWNSIGFHEHRDVIKWAELLRDRFGVDSILIHGICIGSACGLYALLSPDCPENLRGLVADGMYPNFYDSYKYHMIELKKPTFMVLDMINWWQKHYTGYGMEKGPADMIHTYDKPLLMLHGKGDLYSLPEEAQKLYDKCPSEQKQLVWFEGGLHSRLRYQNKELYDRSISEFVDKCYANKA